MPMPDLSLSALRRDYLSGRRTPRCVIEDILHRLPRFADDYIWISQLPAAELLARADALTDQDPARLPLYGVPFAIKDNIDLAGLPTTAACRSAKPPSTSSPPVWWVCAHPTAPPAMPSIRPILPVVPAAAQRWRWPVAWSASRSAPTPPVPDECRRRSTVWWA